MNLFLKYFTDHIVQSMCSESVLSFEYRVEVMSVPVVADEGENGDPNIGLKRVPLNQRQRLFCTHWVENRLDLHIDKMGLAL